VQVDEAREAVPVDGALGREAPVMAKPFEVRVARFDRGLAASAQEPAELAIDEIDPGRRHRPEARCAQKERALGDLESARLIEPEPRGEPR